jgi:hypothetical protein
MELAAGDKRPRDEANTPGQSMHDLRFDERPRHHSRPVARVRRVERQTTGMDELPESEAHRR